MADLVRIRRTPEVFARWRGGDDLDTAVDEELAEPGVTSYVVEVDSWICWSRSSPV